MNGSTDLRALFAAYASGEITASQLEALEGALRVDVRLRAEFIEYLNIDSALGDLAALTGPEIADVEQESEFEQDTTSAPLSRAAITSRGQAWSRRGLRLALAIATIAATMLVAVTVWLTRPEVVALDAVATLVKDVDALLLRDGQNWSDSGLPVGKYELHRGLLNLRFGGDVLVYVEAPARFEAVDEKRLLLMAGRLSASVPPSGVGFTVETPEAEVVDYGTEFSVDVEGGASEVHVFDGLVRVQPRTAREETTPSVDLRTSQAIRIDPLQPKPIAIELSPDRFIRSFDEPELGYRQTLRGLSPVVYYGMPIKSNGMQGEPVQYSGTLLLSEGGGKETRGPYAAGFVGGALRVLKRSLGRGALVDAGPPLKTGHFSLVAMVYAESHRANATVIRNMANEEGNFSLIVDEAGLPQVIVQTNSGDLISCKGVLPLELETWNQLIVVADGERLRLFVDGSLAAESPCADLRPVDAGPYWIGTSSQGDGLWDGRLDEFALFDRALRDEELATLAEAARVQHAARLKHQAQRSAKPK